MKTGLIVVGVLVVIVVIAFMWGIGVNNQLVGADVAVSEKWAQVQNVYQRRADLIPNLVETVKGFATQERTVLEEVTQARASAGSIKATPELLNDPAAFKKFQDAQNQLGGALSRLLVTVERQRFNEAVRDYNLRVRVFPASFIASLRGFKEKPFFESTPGAETVPKVKF